MPDFSKINRRSFVQTAAAATGVTVLPQLAQAEKQLPEKTVRIGLITDLHQDVMHDGQQRLERFLSAMEMQNPDAILQMGDFAVPARKNRTLVETFNRAHSRALHVLGNHDIDGGYTTEQVLDFWGMEKRYYSLDISGVRLIVLDGNEMPAQLTSKYPSHVGREQLDWLREQLATHLGPIVVVSHQPLAGVWAVDNASEVQEVLSSASNRVVLALNGHSHIDDLLRVGGVAYLHVNSASYVWVGEDYKHASYSEEILNKHPRLEKACPYRDALFTSVTVDVESGNVAIEGCETEWVGKSPAQLGRDKHPTLINGEQIAPRIRARQIDRVAS